MKYFAVVFACFVSFSGSAQMHIPELWGLRVHDDAPVLAQYTVNAFENQIAAYEDSTANHSQYL